MKLVLLLLLAIPSLAAPLKEHRVAVIDTGFGMFPGSYHAKLCNTGHADFSGENMFHRVIGVETQVPFDKNGHGTNIAGVITENAGAADFCLVIIKFYRKSNSNSENADASVKAIRYANSIGVDVINFSGGGGGSKPDERTEVLKFLDRGGVMIAAAGNDGQELGVGGYDYFPAMYDKRITVVGNMKYDNGKIRRSDYSNFGKLVTVWEVGDKVTSNGITMSGTSQATAIATAKFIKQKYGAKQCK